MPTSQCVYCGKFFRPDPRVGQRQKACFDPACQKKRHDEADAVWKEKNPKANKGRYSETKSWRKKHPRYQRKWRQQNPDKVALDNRQHRERRRRQKRENAEIRDERLRRKIKVVKGIRSAEIQDEMRLKIDGIIELFEIWPTPDRAEIQDSMASSAPSVTRSAA